MRCRHLLATIGLLVASQVFSAQATAQVVEVVVKAQDSSGPLVGAVVSAIDSLGRTHLTRAAAPEEPLRMTLPFPGTWTLRSRRFGFLENLRAVVVEAGSEKTITVELEADPIPVRGLEVGVERRCPDRSADPAVASIWQEARAILTPDTDIAQRGTARFQVVTERRHFKTWEVIRDLDAARENNRWNQYYDTVWVEGSVPISEPEPDSLLSHGFIVPVLPNVEVSAEFEYSFPGPRTILSTTFLESHCFFIMRQDDMENWVGLGFAPDKDATLQYDVEGTLWLPRTAEVLPLIEFRHTAYPHEGSLWEWDGVRNSRARRAWLGDRVGGEVELSYVPELGWIIHYFSLQWPSLEWRRERILEAHVRNRLRPGQAYRPERGEWSWRWVWWLWSIMDREVRVTRIELREGSD